MRRLLQLQLQVVLILLAASRVRAALPVITSVTPYGSPGPPSVLAPAQAATLQGTGFGETAPVLTLNGTTCKLIIATDTRVDFQVPSNASAGKGSVIITTSAGSSVAIGN